MDTDSPAEPPKPVASTEPQQPAPSTQAPKPAVSEVAPPPEQTPATASAALDAAQRIQPGAASEGPGLASTAETGQGAGEKPSVAQPTQPPAK